LRAAVIHDNAAALTSQEAELRKRTGALAAENARWAKAVARNTRELKKLRDVQNWAEVLERDLLVLEETVRLVDVFLFTTRTIR
jgi:hypothetical protein